MKEPQPMTDLDLVPNSCEQSMLAEWLAHMARKSVVPGSSHNNGGFFPVFVDSKPTISSDRCTSIKGFNMLKYPVTKTFDNNNQIDY